jgi:hypothetical protein
MSVYDTIAINNSINLSSQSNFDDLNIIYIIETKHVTFHQEIIIISKSWTGYLLYYHYIGFYHD